MAFSHYKIGRISRRALADLPSLEELDLSGNKLIADALSDSPIFDLPNLRELRLADNKLAALDADVLVSLKSLKHLDLSGNAIDNLAANSLSHV